jgi:hypothetical protein
MSSRGQHEQIQDRVRVQDNKCAEMRRIADDERKEPMEDKTGRRNDLFVVGSVCVYLYQGL